MKNFFKKNKLEISLWLLILSFSLFMLSFFIIEYDYFWHIKAGEYMYNNHILKRDIFSWYVSGKYWMSHEWLFEIILYFFKLVFKGYHVIIYSMLSLMSLVFLIFFPNRKKIKKNVIYTIFYLLFFFILSLGYIQARPHLFSFSLLAITIYLLYDLYNNENSKKIYFLPLISIFWANFHGGSSNLPYLFCLLFLVGGSFSFKFKKIEAFRLSKIQVKRYIIVMLLCMIAVCINVHGIKMFIYPYLNMLDSTMLNNISEWKATTLNYWFNYFYFGFLLFIVFTLLFSKEKIKFMDFLLLLFVMYLGIKSVRFWFYTYICVSYFIFNYISVKENDKGSSVALLILACLLFTFFITSSGKIFNVKYKVNIDQALVDIIKKEKPKRLFNMYNYGGELIYHDIDVFIDGRADLYTNYNYKDYLTISNLSGDYIKLINKYNFDYYLVSKNSNLYYYLKYDDSLMKIYSNKKLVLYKKMAS